MSRALIIGGSGFVGGHLLRAAQALGFEAHAADTASEGPPLYHPLDITDAARVLPLMEALRPAIVINAAAIADIDFAERNHALAEAVNIVGTSNVAAACQAVGAKYIWFSSDAVYSGRDNLYTEDNRPNPINYYGVTKMLGEQAVLDACPDALIPRLSLVLGLPVRAGNSFIGGLRRRLSLGELVRATKLEVRTPIDVLTLCDAVFELADKRACGICHIGATESIDRFSLTRRLAVAMGYDKALVVRDDAVDPERALRHKNGVLSVARAQSMLSSTELLNLKATIERALRPIDRKE